MVYTIFVPEHLRNTRQSIFVENFRLDQLAERVYKLKKIYSKTKMLSLSIYYFIYVYILLNFQLHLNDELQSSMVILVLFPFRRPSFIRFSLFGNKSFRCGPAGSEYNSFGSKINIITICFGTHTHHSPTHNNKIQVTRFAMSFFRTSVHLRLTIMQSRPDTQVYTNQSICLYSQE